MRLLKHQERNWSLAGFTNGIVTYGYISDKNSKKYRLEIQCIKFVLPIYRSVKKPIFKNIHLLSILALPIWLLVHLFFITAFSISVFFSYPFTTLIERSFLSQFWEFVIGWLWIAFAFFGMLSAIYFVFL